MSWNGQNPMLFRKMKEIIEEIFYFDYLIYKYKKPLETIDNTLTDKNSA